MRTKNRHTSKLLTEKTHPMMEIFFEYAQLKNLYRQGWLKRGVSELDCENVADHSFGFALLGYTIAEEYRPDLDSAKVMKLGLFHEIGEIYEGDFTPTDNVTADEKTQKEYQGVQQVFSRLPNSQKYISIWEDFEFQKSPESRFVKQIDRLEMALQANLYERMNYDGLDEFFPYVQDRISSPELKPILDDILKAR